MKNLLLLLLAAFAAGFSMSCGSGKDTGGFGETLEVRADSIAVHEIFQPSFFLNTANWSTIGDKAVIISDASPDTLAYVYQLPDFTFLYAGIRAGNGPEDLHSSSYMALPRQSDSLVLFWNPGVAGMFTTLTDTGFVVGDRVAKDIPSRHLDAVPPADSLHLDFVHSVPAQLVLYDLGHKGWTDSVSVARQLYTVKRYGMFDVYRNVPNVIGNGAVYAAVYPYTGRIEFYDVSTGKIVLTNMVVGDDTPPEELKKKDLSNSPVYVQLASDGKYLYVLESLRQEKKITDCNILVYDWQGNPVGKYHPDKLIHAILAYDGKVYGYNADMDFEQVYVYDLGV